MKILDFGLAKLRERRVPDEGPLSQQATVPRTSSGVILGTAGYMSPEQVRGQEVDQRSDIFSFGAVLYEVLSGQRAFRGDTAVQTMNAILTEDPPTLSSVSPALPPVLERIVNRCLEKQPEDRFHSAHDLGIALQTISGSAGEITRDGVPLPGPRFRWRAWKVALAAAALVLAGALASLVALWVVQEDGLGSGVTLAPENPTRFSVTLPTTQTFKDVGYVGSAVAISRDGRQIVYGAWEGETTRLYHRPVDALEAEAIPGTEGAKAPFLSPDGSEVGFYADGLLKKVLLRGGAPIHLDDVPLCYGGDWGRDGEIVTAFCSFGLTRVPAAGGMGEVYRAKDTKLGRVVALEVLSEEFAHGRGRLKRFEQEARSASAAQGRHVGKLVIETSSVF